MTSAVRARAPAQNVAHESAISTGEEKARRAAERFPLERYSVIYAYGDTLEDRAMLAWPTGITTGGRR
jgi:hypothetical protein